VPVKNGLLRNNRDASRYPRTEWAKLLDDSCFLQQLKPNGRIEAGEHGSARSLLWYHLGNSEPSTTSYLGL